MFMSASTMDGAMSGSSDKATSSPSAAAQAVVDWDWKQLAADAFVDDERPIILFDGVCNLCDAGVNFAIDHDERAKFRFCSLQSKVAQSLLLRCGKSPEDKANIMLIAKDDSYFSSDAVSRICMELDPRSLQWFGHLGQFVPDWVRESLFQLVSRNRYKFGENDSCRLDFDGTYTSRFISDPMDD
jgi:predicted DCC family thiol-disulfide oxidoreductase YuxK